MFFLTDVASASIVCLEWVRVVVSATCTVGDDNEANTVGFAVTDSSSELTATLKLYCITNNTVPFYYILYIY